MMRRRRDLWPIAGALLGTACVPDLQAPGGGRGGTEAQAGPGGARGSGRPVRGGTLTLALPRDANNFDPLRSNDAYSTTVMATVLDSLYELDQEGKVRGRLVEKTENPQPNVYQMTLRRGVAFHDGTPLDAEAVRFNLRRHLETPGSARGQDVRDITALEVLDPLTLRVTLRAPFAPFPGKLIGGAGYIVSPAAVQRLGEALQRDLTGAGSGPYRFVQWQKDTQVVVERNAGYWKKNATGESLPYLDRIVFRPFPDENVRLANLRTGDADALVDNPPYKDIAALKGDPSLSVRELPGLGFSLFLLNTRAEPFDNPAVRRALSLALDREQLVKTIFFGNGRPLDGAVPETISWAYQREDRPYMRRDLARARAELQGAGKAGGVRFTMQVPNNSPERLQIAELVQDQLKEAGLEMEIRPLDFGTVLANGSAGAFDAIALGTSGDVDPDGNLYSLTHSASAQNLGRYSNPEVDRLLEEGRAALDIERRAALYRQVQRILDQDQPFVVYFNPPQLSISRRTVQSYPQTYNGYWGSRDLEQTWRETA